MAAADAAGLNPMLLNCVTVTGADDSIQPAELLWLSARYSFLEFGILLSMSQIGSSRFPSLRWQESLAQLLRSRHYHYSQLPLSAHLCGEYVRRAFHGDIEALRKECPLWSHFRRLQLNTHGIEHDADIERLTELVRGLNDEDKSVIFQFDGANTATIKRVDAEVQASVLYDFSHGGGKLPETWQRALPCYCGYAGGLGPENVEEQLKAIACQHGDDDAWIDAETKLFHPHGEQPAFCGMNVIRFAEAAKPWVAK